jgi:hypothetical protein
MIDDNTFTEVRDVSWQITTYPEVTFKPGNGGFAVVLGKPGTLRLTGSGIPLNGNESDRVSFAADCGVYLNNVWLTPTENGFTLRHGTMIGMEFSDARCRRPVN